MTRFPAAVCRMLALFAAVAAADASAACSRTLRMGWMEWPPYSVSGADGSPTGIDIELVRRIAREAGCTLELTKGIPSQRQQVYLREGKLDLQFAASDVPARHAFAWFSRPYRHEVIALFARPGEGGNYPVRSLADLARSRWKVIAPDAGWFGAHFQTIRPLLQTQERLSTYRSSFHALQMLGGHRGDLLVGDYYALVHAARATGQPPLDVLPVTVNDEPIHLMLSKTSLTMADLGAIDAAIERLRKRGVLRDIAAQYGMLQEPKDNAPAAR